MIAEKHGFFAAEHLSVKVTLFDSAAIGISVLQSGRIDVVLSSTVATLQALEQGLEATVLFSGRSRAQFRAGSDWWFAGSKRASSVVERAGG